MKPAIPYFPHNFKLGDTEHYSSEWALNFVHHCGGYGINGEHATAAEIKAALALIGPGPLIGASLPVYQTPSPLNKDVCEIHLDKAMHRIKLLSDHAPVSWWFLEASDSWGQYLPLHNDIVANRLIKVTDAIRDATPKAKIVFYKYGSTVPDSSLGFQEERLFPYAQLRGHVDHWSVPFYHPAELRTCRRQLDETYARSQQYGYECGVVPWCGPGMSYVPKKTGPWEYVESDYDKRLDAELGAYINRDAYRKRGLAHGWWEKIPAVLLYQTRRRYFKEHAEAHLGMST